MNERINQALDELCHAMPELVTRRNVPMSGMTTLRLGGPADMVCEPENENELKRLLLFTRELRLPLMVIGRGSNLLVKDGGIRGVVITLGRMSGMETRGCVLTAQGGAALPTVSRRAAELGLAGLCFAGGIPGSVGGGVLMNAGAYGGEMSQVVTLAEGLTMDGVAFAYTGAEMGFAHRSSRLQGEKVIVTRVTFDLKQGNRQELLAEIAELNRRRAEKQPLQQPSAGSTFKRPVGGYASALVDQCGLKGFRVGGAQVSEKHAGFCINLGGTARDFLRLMEEVQNEVERKTGIHLEPEVRIVGED